MIKRFRCLNCGKEIVDKRHPNRTRKYCSNKCQWEHQRKAVLSKECPNCGAIFRRKNPKQIFCSQKCWRIFNDHKSKREIQCPTCGRVFKEYDSNNRKFCSKKCYLRSGLIGKNLRLWNLSKIGKSYEELYGKEKAKQLKELHRQYAYQSKWFTKGKMSLPSDLELEIAEEIKSKSFPFNHTGQGEFWIGFPPKNPDFVHKELKKVIEILGDYWHTDAEVKERTSQYLDSGFEVLNIWEHEWKADRDLCLKRIESFGKR